VKVQKLSVILAPHNMDNTSIALISGLLSSLSTIFATKLLDIFQNKKQHRYSIEKLYFEKKINAAELIVSQLTILSGAIMHCSILFERLKEKDYFEEDNEFETNVDRNLELTIDKQLKQAENSAFVIANALTLYFDIGDKGIFAKEFSKELHNLVGQVGIKLEAMDNAYDHFLKVRNTNENSKAVDAFNLANTEYKNHIQMIADKYGNFYSELLTIVKLIRKDISQYEVQ
jgi:Holliday junction resolvasome RuvABC endonuclease subunit